MNIKIGIVGAIVIAFTVALFALLDFYWLALHTWALAFLLVAEIVFFGGMIAMSFAERGHNRVFFRSGLSSALFLYLITTIFAVILFAWIFPLQVNVFVLIHLGLIALFAVITVLVLAFSKRLAVVDAKSHDAVHETKAKRGGF